MSNEQLIADAILQLKNDSNIFKDYLFPIAMAFFSSLLGASLGYLIYRRQEKIALEKYKLDIANKWSIIAYELQQKLVSIKANYHIKFNNSNPILRIISVPPILMESKNYEFKYFELIPILNGNKEDKYNVGSLSCIFENYLNMYLILQKRNEFYIEAINQLSKANINFESISYEEFLNHIDKKLLWQLIDFNEMFLILVDDLIVEFTEFVQTFPTQISKVIDLKLIKAYGGLVEVDIKSNKEVMELLKYLPRPDFPVLSKITGRPIEELMARYKPLFRKL